MYKKLNVSQYDLETIAEQLVSQGIVDTLRKATTSHITQCYGLVAKS